MQVELPVFPELSTERLLLRQLTPMDAGQLFILRSDETVNKYLDRPKAASVEDAKAFINKINLGISSGQNMYWGICFKESPEVIGTICLWNFSKEESKTEIGYELLPQFHGKGIMQEAFMKVLDFAFHNLQMTSIDAWTTIQNDASKKILQRNGFKRNEELENTIDRSVEGPDLVIYSLSKETFKPQVAVL